MLEDLAPKGWLIWNIEGETSDALADFENPTTPRTILHRHDLTGPDFPSGCRYSCRCEEVQSTNLENMLTWRWIPRTSKAYIVVVAPNPSCFRWRTWNLRQLLSCWELRTIWVPRNGGRSLVHSQEIFDLRQTLTSRILGVSHDGRLLRLQYLSRY
jgi:hypothetical protein